MSKRTKTILFTLAVVIGAVLVLLAYDLYAAVSEGGITLSQAWSEFGRENPFVVFLCGNVSGAFVYGVAAHLWWSVWEKPTPKE